MFLIDKPFVSEFLKDTIKQHNIPVVVTDAALRSEFSADTQMLSEYEAVTHASADATTPIYMNSENAIGWLAQHDVFASLSAKIDLFKNKIKFRDLTRGLFPDFFYRGVAFKDLDSLDYDELAQACKGTFILKPAVGFFSMGVYFIASHSDWVSAISAIAKDMDAVKNLYPKEVMDAGEFIIEQCIHGEEYAVDAYYDAAGDPVILGVLKHAFASEDDVSDRVYLSSKEIIEDNLATFTDFLRKVGRLADVKTFPVHVELRVDETGKLLLIEVNPMRFGGWCTTADLTAQAYGFNPYVAYSRQETPDWQDLLKDKAGKVFALVVLDNSTGLAARDIASFDYDQLLSRFEKPLDLRKVDIKNYPVFGFLLTETRTENYAELQSILDSDLSEFVVQIV